MISVNDRKAMVHAASDRSISWQCKALGLCRSTFYYKGNEVSERDHAMMQALDKLYLEDPTRGTRRMADELNKLGHQVGRTHTRTLMQKMRLKTVYCRPRTTIIDPKEHKYPYLLRNLDIKEPNQVWAMDITYVPMKKGFMYLTAIMDLHSRYIVGWSLSNTMEASWVIDTLNQAVAKYGAPQIINTDQGSQFTSDLYCNYIKSLETTRISMDGKGRAIDNVFIERFWRTIKYDKLYLTELHTGRDVEQSCDEFIRYYNDRRGHSSLDKRTPASIYRMAA